MTLQHTVQLNNGLSISYGVRKLELKHKWTIARGFADFKDNVFINVEKDGITGFGEAAPNIRYDETPDSTIEFIKKALPVFEKFDLRNYYDLTLAIQNIATQETAAKCALDIAIMDWITKSKGIAFHQYLGLNKNKAPVTTFSIGIDTPDLIKQKIAEAAEFPVYKIKLGSENDEKIIKTVRSVTDKPIRVDANEGWKSKEEALEKIKWLQTQNVEFIEQPMPADMLEESEWLRQHCEVPIIADESVKTTSDIVQLAKCFDGINIKLMKAGGVQEALRMIWLAKALDMKIMLGCMVESSVAISAAASLSPLVDYADLDGNLLIKNDPFSGVKTQTGKLVLNDEPGFGVAPRF